MSPGYTSLHDGLDLNPAGALLPGCVYCTVNITKAKLGSHAVSRGWSCWALGCPLPPFPQTLSPPPPRLHGLQKQRWSELADPHSCPAGVVGGFPLGPSEVGSRASL